MRSIFDFLRPVYASESGSMSLTSLDYDNCTYKTELRQSVGPGQYMTATPMPNCRDCFARDPRLRLARSGNARCSNLPLIDVDSELTGLTRKASKCPFDKWLPSDAPACELTPAPECHDEQMTTEDTRLSNPPCTLRGTDNGFNRWQWLCQNPQARVEVPFDLRINSRTLFKDNHRPCIPTPLDQGRTLPPHRGDTTQYAGTLPCEPNQFNHPMPDVVMGSQTWRPCSGLTGCPPA